jgi:lysophospholipase L1-like esterase
MRVGIVAARAGLVVGSLLLTVLLLEALLQVGAWYVRSSEREPVGLLSTSRMRVLCVGDSNTYGMWVDRSDAYPARLESTWNESGRAPRIEALNLGHPGNNSSRLLRNLPEMLESLDPDWVVIMVGANDFWTEPVEIDADPAPSTLWTFLRRTRVHRLAYMVRRGFEAEEVKVEAETLAPGTFEWSARIGDRELDLGSATRRQQDKKRATTELMRNLAAAIERVEQHPARVVLMTYPSRKDLYGASNHLTRAVAAQMRIPLVDLARAFGERCVDIECSELLLQDQHPRPEGYALVAEALSGVLEQEAAPPQNWK